jgi:hypothetical protein
MYEPVIRLWYQDVIFSIMSTTKNYNKYLYIGFTSLGIYFLLTGQYEQAPIHLGVALAFDPFDQNQAWKKRPVWQRSMLIVHLAVTAAVAGYLIGFYDR